MKIDYICQSLLICINIYQAQKQQRSRRRRSSIQPHSFTKQHHAFFSCKKMRYAVKMDVIFRVLPQNSNLHHHRRISWAQASGTVYQECRLQKTGAREYIVQKVWKIKEQDVEFFCPDKIVNISRGQTKIEHTSTGIAGAIFVHIQPLTISFISQ